MWQQHVRVAQQQQQPWVRDGARTQGGAATAAGAGQPPPRPAESRLQPAFQRRRLQRLPPTAAPCARAPAAHLGGAGAGQQRHQRERNVEAADHAEPAWAGAQALEGGAGEGGGGCWRVGRLGLWDPSCRGSAVHTLPAPRWCRLNCLSPAQAPRLTKRSGGAAEGGRRAGLCKLNRQAEQSASRGGNAAAVQGRAAPLPDAPPLVLAASRSTTSRRHSALCTRQCALLHASLQ